MPAPAYMMSLLGRQRALLGADFFKHYSSDWLVWEPGPWHPARTLASSNTETTHQPTAAPTRPDAGDALCFELKRAPGATLSVGRATEHDIVLNDLTVSRNELRLTLVQQRWQAHATAPSLRLDGAPLPPEGATLANGAVLTAGDVKLTFYTSDGFPARLATESQKKRER